MVNDNGIITTLNPETGAVLKQGRLTGALGPHFASPVAADGHIFFTTESGAVVVVAPGGDFSPLAINQLGEDTYATPRIRGRPPLCPHDGRAVCVRPRAVITRRIPCLWWWRSGMRKRAPTTRSRKF
jgi:hypothetical protein